jgi:DNA polymerase-4
MNDNYNTERPLVMHIDLNSCFATVEQQARPMLRGRPVAIVNRRTENTAIITASYEAKKYGVKVGMRFKEAKLLVPDIIPIETDPPQIPVCLSQDDESNEGILAACSHEKY